MTKLIPETKPLLLESKMSSTQQPDSVLYLRKKLNLIEPLSTGIVLVKVWLGFDVTGNIYN